jgi:hypothetical protein
VRWTSSRHGSAPPETTIPSISSARWPSSPFEAQTRERLEADLRRVRARLN